MTAIDARLRPQYRMRSIPAAITSQLSVDRRVGITWYLLLLNALTYYPGLSALHIPSAAGKLITQGSLFAAFIVALTINRKVVFRPNVLLTIVTVLVLGAIVTCLVPQHLGTIYRTVRLGLFVSTLWLLTPWWGRSDLLLLRFHLRALCVVLLTVVMGLFIAPSQAMTESRLTGVIWPIPPTEVAHYAAIVFGLVVVLWMCGEIRGRPTVYVASFAGAILILTHTRTALIGMIVGIVIAGLSLIRAKPRVRKLFTAVGTMAAIALLTLSGFITSWLGRGQSSGQIDELTGRTAVWSALLSTPRDKFQEIFGFGLSNNSFNGLPIDSNWLASYQAQGLFGVTICALMLLYLLIAAYFQPRGTARALALFLTSYCLVASFTEVGFTDVSPYLLEITLAASLIVASRQRQSQT